MLLFLLASGLTLIFSMMGVLNFAHASFYMLGAFFGFQISRWVGFWPALVIAPLLVGAIGAAGRALRPAPRAQVRPCRRAAVHLRPRLRDRGNRADDLGQERRSISACRRRSTSRPSRSSRPTIPPTSMFMLADLDRDLRRPAGRAQAARAIGLIIQAALTHPHMVGHLGHNVPRVFMLVFGVGTALAGLAGVIAGPALVTQPNMAGAARADPVRGRGGRRARLAAGRLRRLAADRPAADLRGLDQRARSSDVVRPAQLRLRRRPGSRDIWNVTVAQIAPIMPYLLLVLMLIFRPTGLLGTRDT